MPIVDRCFVSVAGASCACEKVQIKTSRDVKRVDALTRRRRSVGYRRGNVHYEVTLDAVVYEGGRSPDWHNLLETGREVEVVIEYSDGIRDTFSGCTVSDCSDDFAADGGGPTSVTIQARDRSRR
jgi:hypothetical protein